MRNNGKCTICNTKPQAIVYYSVVNGIRCNDAVVCNDCDDRIQGRPTLTGQTATATDYEAGRMIVRPLVERSK